MTESTDWQQEIANIEEECRLAFLRKDLPRLRELWSKDLYVNSPFNRINDRAQVLDLLERGIIEHLSQELKIELITRYGDIVVVMGHDVVQNAPDGPFITRRFTNVWSPVEGSWQLIARQATHIG